RNDGLREGRRRELGEERPRAARADRIELAEGRESVEDGLPLLGRPQERADRLEKPFGALAPARRLAPAVESARQRPHDPLQTPRRDETRPRFLEGGGETLL